MKDSRKEQDPQKRLALLKKGFAEGLGRLPLALAHVERFVIAYSSKIKDMVVTPTGKFYPQYITMK